MLTDRSQGDFGVVCYVAWTAITESDTRRGVVPSPNPKICGTGFDSGAGGKGQGNTYRILKNGDKICDSARVSKQSPAIIWKVGNIQMKF